MVILGLVLILGGIAAILAALFTASGTAQLVGFDLNALTVFFLGVASAVAVLWGWALIKHGTKRSLKQRKERKELSRLSEKLDRVQAEHRAEANADTDSDTDTDD
jgi:membrane protein implicated in regulation of membrane protease activity